VKHVTLKSGHSVASRGETLKRKKTIEKKQKKKKKKRGGKPWGDWGDGGKKEKTNFEKEGNRMKKKMKGVPRGGRSNMEGGGRVVSPLKAKHLRREGEKSGRPRILGENVNGGMLTKVERGQVPFQNGGREGR